VRAAHHSLQYNLDLPAATEVEIISVGGSCRAMSVHCAVCELSIVVVVVDAAPRASGRAAGSFDMAKLCSSLSRFLCDESGTETLEWGLVCGLLVIGAITALALIGPKVTDMWNDVNNEIPAAAP
jgi:Flp pilus assembly pilin Flp